MVTIGMNYRVIDGKQKTFVSMFNKVLETMRDIDGHTETHLYRDVNDACAFLIVSQWSSREDFDAFINSDRFRKVADWGREQILVGRPEHHVYGHYHTLREGV